MEHTQNNNEIISILKKDWKKKYKQNRTKTYFQIPAIKNKHIDLQELKLIYTYWTIDI